MRIGGCCQRGVKYALWAYGEASTSEILEWAYPWGPGKTRKQRKARATAVRYAARRLAIVVGRRWPDGNVWRLKDAT
jgi:hypothetical protein